MNRRSFFKGLLAVPVVAALAPLLPKPSVSDGAFRAADLWTAKDSIRLRYGAELWKSSPLLMSKVDISEVLYRSLTLEDNIAGLLPCYSSPLVPKDTVWLLDSERLHSGPWIDPTWLEGS